MLFWEFEIGYGGNNDFIGIGRYYRVFYFIGVGCCIFVSILLRVGRVEGVDFVSECLIVLGFVLGGW